MQPLKVTCPKCQRTISVASKSGKEDIQVTCPYCLSPIHVVVRQKPVSLGAAPQQPAWQPQQPQPAPLSGETQFSPVASHADYQPKPQYQAPQPQPRPAAPQSGETQFCPVASAPVNPQPAAKPAFGPQNPIAAKPHPQNFTPQGAQPKQGFSAAEKQAIFNQTIYAPQQPKPAQQPQQPQPQYAACPMLVLNGQEYHLNVGRNTVGRKAHSSSSLIQIVTDDRYMSRTNAIVEVYRLPNGWQVCISSYNEDNLVKINGLPVPMGDRIILMPGMIITLGRTELLFTIK